MVRAPQLREGTSTENHPGKPKTKVVLKLLTAETSSDPKIKLTAVNRYSLEAYSFQEATQSSANTWELISPGTASAQGQAEEHREAGRREQQAGTLQQQLLKGRPGIWENTEERAENCFPLLPKGLQHTTANLLPCICLHPKCTHLTSLSFHTLITYGSLEEFSLDILHFSYTHYCDRNLL